MRCIGVGGAVRKQLAFASPQKKRPVRGRPKSRNKTCTPSYPVTQLPSCQMRQGKVLQWLCELRCAHAVVRFSTQLNSSYMAMAMAPTTSKPAKASPICMEEPAEISK